MLPAPGIIEEAECGTLVEDQHQAEYRQDVHRRAFQQIVVGQGLGHLVQRQHQ